MEASAHCCHTHVTDKTTLRQEADISPQAAAPGKQNKAPEGPHAHRAPAAASWGEERWSLHPASCFLPLQRSTTKSQERRCMLCPVSGDGWRAARSAQWSWPRSASLKRAAARSAQRAAAGQQRHRAAPSEYEQSEPNYPLWGCFRWGFASASTPAGGLLLVLVASTWPAIIL